MVAFLIKEGFDVRSDDNEALIYYITFICQYRIETERSLGILRLLLEAGQILMRVIVKLFELRSNIIDVIS